MSAPSTNSNIAQSESAGDLGIKRKRSSTSPEPSNAVTVKKQHISYIDEDTALILVGAEKRKFHIHAQKLSEVSTFFQAALESGFKEAGDRVINLPEDDVEIFDCFMQWLYHQQIDTVEGLNLEIKDDIRASETRNSDFYIFAEKYDIPGLKRYAATNLSQLVDQCRAPSHVKVAKWYQQTVASSGLRRLLSDWYAWGVKSDYLNSNTFRTTLYANPEFAVDLVGALGRVMKGAKRRDVNVDEYI